ncbi:hypothetical protein ACFV2H_35660 [Streptomyces sp. NPDC059629]|uniref:hypothetical protein n=1 Tax=Streptomyces sp. NPDC059629 TaxID=3346889 RepID=UPI0036A7CB5A
MGAYSKVRARLSGDPGLLGLLDAMAVSLRGLGTALAVRGGLARGRVDSYSDLDLVLYVAPEADRAAVGAAVGEHVARWGRLLTMFPADHVGLPHLFVFLVAREGAVLKLDVAVEFGPGNAGRTASEVEIWRERRRIAPNPDVAASPVREFDPGRALDRAVGWAWYTHTKLCRGELLEAERTVAFLRALVVVPLLLHRHGLPQEDFRWLEQRLPGPVLDALRSTYPVGTTRGAIADALHASLCLISENAPPEALDGVRRLEETGVLIDRDRPRIS